MHTLAEKRLAIHSYEHPCDRRKISDIMHTKKIFELMSSFQGVLIKGFHPRVYKINIHLCTCTCTTLILCIHVYLVSICHTPLPTFVRMHPLQLLREMTKVMRECWYYTSTARPTAVYLKKKLLKMSQELENMPDQEMMPCKDSRSDERCDNVYVSTL